MCVERVPASAALAGTEAGRNSGGGPDLSASTQAPAPSQARGHSQRTKAGRGAWPLTLTHSPLPRAISAIHLLPLLLLLTPIPLRHPHSSSSAHEQMLIWSHLASEQQAHHTRPHRHQPHLDQYHLHQQPHIMTIRSRSQQEVRDSPPPYTMAAETYPADLKASLNDHPTDKKDSPVLPYATTQHVPPPRRYLGLRTLLLLLGLSAGFTYYKLSITPDTSVYGDEVNFHSWSASLSWKNKGHHPHSQSKSHSHSWWKSLTGASSHGPCPHRARVQRTVNGMLEALHANAAYAEPHVDGDDVESLTANNATLSTTIPDVAKYLEEQFLAVPDPQSARAALKSYTKR